MSRNYSNEEIDRFIETVSTLAYGLIVLEFPEYDEEEVLVFMSDFLEGRRNREKVFSQVDVICSNFEEAHERALKIHDNIGTKLAPGTHVVKLLVKRSGGAAPEIVTVFTNLDLDESLLDLVANYPATGDVSTLIKSIKNKHLGVFGEVLGETRSETGSVSEEQEAIDNEQTILKDEIVQEFDLYEAPIVLDEELLADEGSVEEVVEPPLIEEESVQIQVDLSASELVTMRMPETIELPPLSSQSESYVAKSGLGTFELESFDPTKRWEGYFSFEVVRLKDGIQLDKMWLDVNGEKVYPVEEIRDRKKYIHFYISSELFPYVKGGQYTFSPLLELWVPEYALPGQYNAGLYFTMIQ